MHYAASPNWIAQISHQFVTLIPKHNCILFCIKVFVAKMAEEKPTVVAIVDDDESVRSALQGLMKEVGFSALAFACAEEFLDSGEQRHIGCLIADIRLPGMSGVELQSKLIRERHRIPIIFITAHGDQKMRMQALRAGAVEFLTKPFDDEALLDNVRAALGLSFSDS
jgi:FixJ family two-component response regulator